MAAIPTRPAPLLPPGTYIEEWLEDQEPSITQQELAFRLGVSAKHVSQVINGHKPISARMAASLEVVTGFPVEFWLTHQARFDARSARVPVCDEDVAAVKALVPDELLKGLRRSGVITATWEEGPELVRELYSYVKVANVKALEVAIRNGVLEDTGRLVLR